MNANDDTKPETPDYFRGFGQGYQAALSDIIDAVLLSGTVFETFTWIANNSLDAETRTHATNVLNTFGREVE